MVLAMSVGTNVLNMEAGYGRVALAPRFAEPVSVSVSSVTATGATVKFTIPFSDSAATSEQVIVYTATNRNPTAAFSAIVTGFPVTVTGLKASTSYYAEISVNAANGHAASQFKVSSKFTTPRASARSVPAPVATATAPPTFAPAPAEPRVPAPAPTATATATPVPTQASAPTRVMLPLPTPIETNMPA